MTASVATQNVKPHGGIGSVAKNGLDVKNSSEDAKAKPESKARMSSHRGTKCSNNPKSSPTVNLDSVCSKRSTQNGLNSFGYPCSSQSSPIANMSPTAAYSTGQFGEKPASGILGKSCNDSSAMLTMGNVGGLDPNVVSNAGFVSDAQNPRNLLDESMIPSHIIKNLMESQKSGGCGFGRQVYARVKYFSIFLTDDIFTTAMTNVLSQEPGFSVSQPPHSTFSLSSSSASGPIQSMPIDFKDSNIPSDFFSAFDGGVDSFTNIFSTLGGEGTLLSIGDQEKHGTMNVDYSIPDSNMVATSESMALNNNNNPHRRVLSMPAHTLANLPRSFEMQDPNTMMMGASAIPGPRQPSYINNSTGMGGLGIAGQNLASPIGGNIDIAPRITSQGSDMFDENGSRSFELNNHHQQHGTAGVRMGQSAFTTIVNSAEPNAKRPGIHSPLSTLNRSLRKKPCMVSSERANLGLGTSCQSAPVTPRRVDSTRRPTAMGQSSSTVFSTATTAGANMSGRKARGAAAKCSTGYLTPPRLTKRSCTVGPSALSAVSAAVGGATAVTPGKRSVESNLVHQQQESHQPMSSPTLNITTPHRVDRQLMLSAQRPLLFARPKNKDETPRKRRRRCVSSDATKVLSLSSDSLYSAAGSPNGMQKINAHSKSGLERGSSSSSSNISSSVDGPALNADSKEGMSGLQWQRISEQRRRDAMRDNFDLLKRMLPTEYMQSDDGRELARPVLLARFLRFVDDTLLDMQRLKNELESSKSQYNYLADMLKKQHISVPQTSCSSSASADFSASLLGMSSENDGSSMCSAVDWVWNATDLSKVAPCLGTDNSQKQHQSPLDPN
ncbi:hypothetical protein H4219_002890 [Mycoemilia scoparia]|uniref:BHLH domain-containing protein n=1 Tax=Mycoemilia scoparia TaxID=417184 RepID=A0A9W7ZWD3_9FUNG|nr:hypothetical protein H4219_002890 [Mycoemilia scoparia]